MGVIVRLASGALIVAGIVLAVLSFHDGYNHASCGSLVQPRTHELADFPDEGICIEGDYYRRFAHAAELFIPGLMLGLSYETSRWLWSPARPRVAVALEARLSQPRAEP